MLNIVDHLNIIVLKFLSGKSETYVFFWIFVLLLWMDRVSFLLCVTWDLLLKTEHRNNEEPLQVFADWLWVKKELYQFTQPEILILFRTFLEFCLPWACACAFPITPLDTCLFLNLFIFLSFTCAFSQVLKALLYPSAHSILPIGLQTLAVFNVSFCLPFLSVTSNLITKLCHYSCLRFKRNGNWSLRGFQMSQNVAGNFHPFPSVLREDPGIWLLSPDCLTLHYSTWGMGVGVQVSNLYHHWYQQFPSFGGWFFKVSFFI